MKNIVILSIVAVLLIAAPVMMLFEVKLADATEKDKGVCVQATVPTPTQECFNTVQDCKKFIKESNIDGECVKNK